MILPHRLYPIHHRDDSKPLPSADGSHKSKQGHQTPHSTRALNSKNCADVFGETKNQALSYPGADFQGGALRFAIPHTSIL
jgi:hypothetical protein